MLRKSNAVPFFKHPIASSAIGGKLSLVAASRCKEDAYTDMDSILTDFSIGTWKWWEVVLRVQTRTGRWQVDTVLHCNRKQKLADEKIGGGGSSVLAMFSEKNIGANWTRLFAYLYAAGFKEGLVVDIAQYVDRELLKMYLNIDDDVCRFTESWEPSERISKAEILSFFDRCTSKGFEEPVGEKKRLFEEPSDELPAAKRARIV